VSEIIGSGLAFPLGVDHRGGIALAEGAIDIEQAIGLILDTAPGERPMRPEFGCTVHDFVFERIDRHTTGRIEEAVRAALDRWEPRVTVVDITFETSQPGVVHVGVGYRIKATNDVRNLVYPFYVIPEDD
jgi:uncharacterized protein